MRTHIVVLAALSSAWLLACGGSASDGSGSGGSAGSGGGSAGSGGGSAGSGGQSGRSCGGILGANCENDEFCDFPDNRCGAADGSGTCTPRPKNCLENYEPACACDGTVYSNACAANSQGEDISALDGCEPPAGYIPCGTRLCDASSQYCFRGVSDVGNEPDAFDCKPLPSGCDTAGAATCECLAKAGEACAQWCTVVDGKGAQGLKLTCPGG